MKIEVCDNGMDRIIISDGYINKHSLKALNMSRAEIEKILEKKKIAKKDIYLMLIDDKKNVKIFRKDGR